jgi:hypothetical protein
MITKALLAGAVYWVASGTALASSWVQVPVGDQSLTMYFESESLVKEPGQTVKVWTKAVFAKPRVIGGKPTSFMLAHERYDCRGGRSALISLTLYDRSGTPVETLDTPQPFEDAAPDTTAQRQLKAICAVAGF